MYESWSVSVLECESDLLVIANTAGQIAHPRDETHLRNRRRSRARLRKHIITDLGDLTFRLLRGGVEFQAKRLAVGVLQRSQIRANRDSSWRGDALPVADSEAEWIEIAIPEAAFSLVEHSQRDSLVRLY